MQTVEEYLSSTETAVRQLFDGISHYRDILARVRKPMFIRDRLSGEFPDREYEAWYQENIEEIEQAFMAERSYLAEVFSQSTLCGAVLQVADKALEVYSTNEEVPVGWETIIKPNKAKFCVGREVKTVKLGLIIHAGRNQHAHYNESSLRSPNKEVFETLATVQHHPANKNFRHPAFDLNNDRIDSMASNLIALIGWNCYEDYHHDILTLCKT